VTVEATVTVADLRLEVSLSLYPVLLDVVDALLRDPFKEGG
jgi:hypothetical protein